MPNEEIRRLAELIAKAKGNMLGREFSSNLERNFFLAEQLIVNGVFSVVRCKDCKHYKAQEISKHWQNKTKYCCRVVALKVNDDDFCSFGERKVDNVEN